MQYNRITLCDLQRLFQSLFSIPVRINLCRSCVVIINLFSILLFFKVINIKLRNYFLDDFPLADIAKNS